MPRILSGLKLAGICVSAALICSAQSPTFSPLGKVVIWQGDPTPVPTPIPTWSGGAFITVDRTASFDKPTSPAPNIYVSGEQGNTTVKIQLPGAVWTQNRGIARGNDGTLAASGGARDASGQLWSYLAIFPPGATQPNVIHTEPDQATSLAIAPWCQCRGYFASPQPQGGSYFEVSANGAVSKRPLPPLNKGETIDALAITDSGRVLITKSVRGANSKLYALNRSTGIWQLVQFPSTGFEGAGYFILGASGNKIAFWTPRTTGLTAQLAQVQ